VERVAWGGWPDCLRLRDDRVEVVLPTQVGPRLLHLSFVGQPNLLYTVQDDVGRGTEGRWRLYGGHRLWAAPEDAVDTYVPDDQPVAVEEVDGGVRVWGAVEPRGLQKGLHVVLLGGGRLRLTHTLRAVHGSHPVAPWALTCFGAGAVATLPFPPFVPHGEALLPDRGLVLWPYTDLSDQRCRFRPDRLELSHGDGPAWKIGASWPAELAVEVLGARFTKRVVGEEEGLWPDRGAQVELFTDRHMLELETLGPLRPVGPGEELVHVEEWRVAPA
jgi:hypothetical protein